MTEPYSEATLPSPSGEDVISVERIHMTIDNYMCSFKLGTHINLKKLCIHTQSVDFDQAHIIAKLRLTKPCVTVSVYRSGSCIIVGARTIEDAKTAAAITIKLAQRTGAHIPPCTTFGLKIESTFIECSLPFGVKLDKLCGSLLQSKYDPEIFPALRYKLNRCSFSIASNGVLVISGCKTISDARRELLRMYALLKMFSISPSNALT